MMRSIATVAIGALITALSLFLLSLVYPKLFALFGMFFVTACIILGLAVLAAFPKIAREIWLAFVEYMAERNKQKEEEA